MQTEQLYQIFLAQNQNISTDSRKITQGCLFFALKGDHFDANQYATQALEQGAAYAITDDPSLPAHAQIIGVENVLQTLQTLATHHRKTLKIPVIGIAGSNGKTTTKELLNAVLATHFRTHATPGNLNNHIGVPLTLLAMPTDTQIAIVEIGANHPHEVAQLCQIAQPNYGIVTSIGKEHLEGFETLEAIIETEGEMYDYVLQQNGGIFINKNDEILVQRAKKYANSTKDTAIYYGTQTTADCIGELTDASRYIKFRWETAPSSLPHAPEITTQLTGAYNLDNLLAAACIGRYFSVPYHKINAALAAYSPSNNRSQLLTAGTNTIISDAYNANPSSMKLALENLAHHIQATNKMPIIGDMLELGAATDLEHQNTIDLLQFLGFEQAILVGAHFYKQKNYAATSYHFFETTAELKAEMPLSGFQDSFLLLKASRGIGLEKYLT